ncbi:MAG: prepilin-type N-terminal cleavage/methylation domain-containing protein [Phycisphaerales bacterium]|nr:prepilin-type N-terminal cleavage/methylation domain-containing protein [Phycisphaerales bacterium]
MVSPATTHRRPAFTLLELLVVIAIIVIVTALTLVAYRGVATDMRMSAAVQEVGSILEQARSRAIRDSRPTIVAFRSRVTSGGEHFVEAVVGQASGEQFLWTNDTQSSDPLDYQPAARFVPIRGIEPREMPRDVSFATPAHQFGDDELYVMTSRVDQTNEPPGVLPAIMFGPDGEPVSYDQETDAALIFLDFNGDGGQRVNGIDYCNHWEEQSFNSEEPCPPDRRSFTPGFAPTDGCWVLNERLPTGLIHPDEVVFDGDEGIPFCAQQDGDEPFLVLATELMLFDEKAARERYGISTWTRDKPGAARRGRDINGFINETGVRIRLNRYTGVSQREN